MVDGSRLLSMKKQCFLSPNTVHLEYQRAFNSSTWESSGGYTAKLNSLYKLQKAGLPLKICGSSSEPWRDKQEVDARSFLERSRGAEQEGKSSVFMESDTALVSHTGVQLAVSHRQISGIHC